MGLSRYDVRRGIHAIGADVDRSYLGAHFILTSAVKHADVAVLDTVHAVANGVVEDALWDNVSLPLPGR